MNVLVANVNYKFYDWYYVSQDLHEYYEDTLLSDHKSIEEKTAETLNFIAAWGYPDEETLKDISVSANCYFYNSCALRISLNSQHICNASIRAHLLVWHGCLLSSIVA